MSKIDDHRVLKHLKKTEYARKLGRQIYLPKSEYVEMKTETCGLCGDSKKDPVIWFGESFCRKCVESKDPDGIYNREIRGRRGFSRK